MIYALAVHGAPYSSNAAAHALGFADALLARGHQIERVFFFHEGVYQGLNSHVPPQTRYNVNLATRWKSLSEGGTELAICCYLSRQHRHIRGPTADGINPPSLSAAYPPQLVQAMFYAFNPLLLCS